MTKQSPVSAVILLLFLPSAVWLQFAEDQTLTTEFLVYILSPKSCSGTVVSLTWVITSAICCYNFSNPDDYELAAGKEGNLQCRRVSELKIHPDAKPGKPESDGRVYDFALLKVKENWNIGEVKPIILFKEDFPKFPEVNHGCFVLGWNTNLTMTVDKIGPSFLIITAMPWSICARRLHTKIAPDNICVKHVESKWKPTLSVTYPCQGDLGGPLACEVFTMNNGYRLMVVGVMSSYEIHKPTNECKTSYYMGISSAVKWIKQFATDAMIAGVDTEFNDSKNYPVAKHQGASGNNEPSNDLINGSNGTRHQEITLLVLSIYLAVACLSVWKKLAT